MHIDHLATNMLYQVLALDHTGQSSELVCNSALLKVDRRILMHVRDVLVRKDSTVGEQAN